MCHKFTFFLLTSSLCLLKKSYFCRGDERRLSRVGKAGARKVGTAQSTVLPNRKVSERVTDSATERYTAPKG